MNADDIFITFRFGGANGENEARATKAALEAQGTSVFLSEAAAGDNLAKLISDAIVGCKLAVVFASRTYGARTTGGFRECARALSALAPPYGPRPEPY